MSQEQQVVKQEDELVSQDGSEASELEVNDGGDGNERLVPVAEAIRYRKRAQAAETQLTDTKGHLQDLKAELEQAKRAIDQLDRRQQIDVMLADADAVDMEVARLLTEAAVEMMEDADIELAVNDLRRQKPYLFRRNQGSGGAGSMSAHVRTGVVSGVDQVKQQAKSSGDRRDLLRYLRMKRK